MYVFLNAILVLVLALTGLLLMRRGVSRSALEVAQDLLASPGHLPQSEARPSRRPRFLDNSRVLPLLAAAICTGAKVVFVSAAFPSSLAAAGIGLSCGYLLSKAMVRARMRDARRQFDYFLPIVMERVVMAAEAGLDIFAALNSIVQMERKSALASNQELDPVTQLLERVTVLTEAGMRLEDALNTVAASSESSALRHAFIHLALAHREGGELVLPVRELSDATQLYYQESVEEELAALPVKATLPLVLTFAGLLILFLTAPLVQVLGITDKAIGG